MSIKGIPFEEQNQLIQVSLTEESWSSSFEDMRAGLGSSSSSDEDVEVKDVDEDTLLGLFLKGWGPPSPSRGRSGCAWGCRFEDEGGDERTEEPPPVVEAWRREAFRSCVDDRGDCSLCRP